MLIYGSESCVFCVFYFKEGLGNKSDMESVLNFKRSGEGVFAVASTTNSLKVLVDFLTSPAVKIPVRALDVGMITPVEISKACKMSERKRKFFTILAFEAVVTPEASQLAELVGVKVICGLLSDFDFDDFLIRRISRGSIDALKANYRVKLHLQKKKIKSISS